MTAFRTLRIRATLAAALLLPVAASAQSSAAPAAALDTTAHLPQAAPAAPAAAVATVDAGSQGFGLRSADGAFRLRLQGVAHYDGRAFVNDPSGRGISGFEVRRIRADVRGTVQEIYDFRLNLDYAGSAVSLLDAYAEARFSSAFQLRVGKFKPPVGLERLQSVSALTFPERGFPTALVPNRDVGVQLAGSAGGQLASWAIGVFNGVADGGSADADVADSKDAAARLFFHPFARTGSPALRGLGFGVAGSIGSQSGSPSATGLPNLRSTFGRSSFLRFRGDGAGPGSVVLDGRRTRISPQGYWYGGPLGLLGEYVRTTSEVRVGGEARELENRAWQVTGSWVLTGGTPSYRGVVPTSAFDPRRGSWGAVELAGRVQQLSTDEAAFPLLADPLASARSATAGALGLNWYLNRFVRVQADYELTRFDAAQGGVELPDEGVLVTRVQLAF